MLGRLNYQSITKTLKIRFLGKNRKNAPHTLALKIIIFSNLDHFII